MRLIPLFHFQNQIKEMNTAIFYKEISNKTKLQNQLDEIIDSISRFSFDKDSTERKNRLQ